MSKKMTTYKDAGVDIEAADKAVNNIKGFVKKTFNSNVLTNLGSFGACYKFPKNDYESPILVSSADGVGTKLKIANQLINDSMVLNFYCKLVEPD